MARKRIVTEPFPDLFVEALAYHEAGHVLMGVLFSAPIATIAIADRCLEPGFNGHTVFDWGEKREMPTICYALMCVGSEASEKLSPRFEEFKTLHRTHRHLSSFAIGVRNDITMGLNAMVHYLALGHSESTAKQYFKRDVREPAERIVQLNAKGVVAFAEHLRERRCVDGTEAKEILLSCGPLTTRDVLKQYELRLPQQEAAKSRVP